MSATGYEVTFAISDLSNPIEGATVDFGIYGKKISSASGEVIYPSVDAGSIAYMVSAAGYIDAIGTVPVINTAVNEPVSLDLIPVYNVNFTVTDGTNPIAGANIALTGYDIAISNATGLATVDDVIPAANIAYTFTATGYIDASGTISVVDTLVTENISLTEATTGSYELLADELFIYPNPAKSLIHVRSAENAKMSLINTGWKSCHRKRNQKR